MAVKSMCLFILVATSGAMFPAHAQSAITAGTLTGVVTDASSAVVRGATVTLENPLTRFKQSAVTDETGTFRLTNLPFNNYQLRITAGGFAAQTLTVEVRSIVPVELQLPPLMTGVVSESVNVSGSEIALVNAPTTQTTVDAGLMQRLPVASPASGLSDVVTFTSPGVAADSNGFFHPLGDHAQTSINLDNQPINDQQSKAFSTQLPIEAIQSLDIITGAPGAEHGDKTSLVINAVTKSGLGLIKPMGSLMTSYGSFGTSEQTGTLGIGNKRLGNFTAFTFNRSGRFLDSPEFVSLHNRGTALGIFNRFDFAPTSRDTLRLNLQFSRNSFEVPNTYDQNALGQDQRQRVRTVNVAPGYVKVINTATVLTVNPFLRLDEVRYLPSANPFQDETQTLGQQRRLLNSGLRADVAYAKGRHNARFGAQATYTFLKEGFQFGLTDPDFNDPDSPDFIPGLRPFDLTRGGRLFTFNGKASVRQQAVYAQDSLRLGSVMVNAGVRFDNYNGLSQASGWQPRVGLSYQLKATGTVVRASYTRTLESPYNENLVLSSATGAGGLADGILGEATQQPLQLGRRNQYNLGVQQIIGKRVIVDADYFWKFTRNAFDFNVILNTPITFPIAFAKSKLDGLSLRVQLTEWRGLSAFYNAGTTRARFFPPVTGGLFFNDDIPAGVFRIDHEQPFQHTFQAQYQFNRWKKVAPYVSFNWKYDNGLVAGEPTDYATALELTANQQAQMGLFCGSTFATPTRAIRTCADTRRGALRVRIPADGTYDDDHNPIRIAPRHIFNLSAGTDNLLGGDARKIVLRVSALNLLNKEALYNFLSTFGGTHFVAPRTVQAQLGFRF